MAEKLNLDVLEAIARRGGTVIPSDTLAMIARIRELENASSSRAEVEIPEGFALVPKVPTPEMMLAMQSHEWPGVSYEAMLAAAEAPNGETGHE